MMQDSNINYSLHCVQQCWHSVGTLSFYIWIIEVLFRQGCKKEFRKFHVTELQNNITQCKNKMSILPYIANWMLYFQFLNLGFSHNECFATTCHPKTWMQISTKCIYCLFFFCQNEKKIESVGSGWINFEWVQLASFVVNSPSRLHKQMRFI